MFFTVVPKTETEYIEVLPYSPRDCILTLCNRRSLFIQLYTSEIHATFLIKANSNIGGTTFTHEKCSLTGAGMFRVCITRTLWVITIDRVTVFGWYLYRIICFNVLIILYIILIVESLNYNPVRNCYIDSR